MIKMIGLTVFAFVMIGIVVLSGLDAYTHRKESAQCNQACAHLKAVVVGRICFCQQPDSSLKPQEIK